MFRVFCAAMLAVSALAQAPRPEFPQPQFQRDTWMNLNGPWGFEFDDRNVGLSESWQNGTHAYTRTITVPFCFESKKSGIGDTAFHPWIWYRREFAVPQGWRSKRVLLHFGAVDYRATVWVNSRMAA